MVLVFLELGAEDGVARDRSYGIKLSRFLFLLFRMAEVKEARDNSGGADQPKP